MSEPRVTVGGMAFTTRTGRTVAIGHGTMTTVVALWIATTLIFVWAPILTSALILAWYLPGVDQDFLETAMSSTWGLALICIFIGLMVRTFAVAGGAGTYAGPENHLRDQFAAIRQARLTKWVLASAIAALALMIVSRTTFDGRVFVVTGLMIVIAVADVFSIRGLWKVMRSNRKAAYFEGLTEAQKQKIDRRTGKWNRPSFPSEDLYVSPADARRYARRASDIAKIHEWIGGGLILVFSAFVGTTIPAMWESKDPLSQIPVWFVLGFVALGFWLQSRARSYIRLADSLEDRTRSRTRTTIDRRGRQLRATQYRRPRSAGRLLIARSAPSP